MCRMTVAELGAARATLREGGFSFAERYPATHRCMKKEACTGAWFGNNVWFRTHRGGRVVVARGMKDVREARQPRRVIRQVSRPCSSMAEVFGTVEEVLSGYLENEQRGVLGMVRTADAVTVAGAVVVVAVAVALFLWIAQHMDVGVSLYTSMIMK